MSSARDFVREHPALAEAMTSSSAFETVKEHAMLDIDDERLYIVRGDTLGDEEDLFVETLVRGAQTDDPNDMNRVVYQELDDDARALVNQRLQGGELERGSG